MSSPDASPALPLRMPAQQLLLGDAPGALALPLGPQPLQRWLPRFPPSEGQLEAAIAAVEDVLMPVLPQLSAGGARTLLAMDADAVALATAAGDASGAGLEQVERLFNRLARVAAGQPARHEDIPEDAAFAARLLVLRELMHHGGFSRVQVPAR